MRVVTVSIHSCAAVLIGGAGLTLIALSTYTSMPYGHGRIGFALMLIGGVIWLHGQVNRVVEKMSSREDAAYNIGKLSSVRENHR